MTTLDEALESGEPIAWAIVGKRTGDIYSVQRGRTERYAEHLDAVPLYARPVVTDEMVEAGAIALHAWECGDETCDHILNEFESSSRAVLEAALTPPNE